MPIILAALLVVAAQACAGPGKAKMSQRQVAVSGYGVTFELLAPFEMNRLGEQSPVDDAVVLAHPGGRGLKNALLAPGKTVAGGPLKKEFQVVPGGKAGDGLWTYRSGSDGTSITLGADMKDVSEVGSAGAGPTEKSWSIQTAAYRVAWPKNWKLVSTEPGTRSPFELIGTNGAMIMLRGPLKGSKELPTPPQLVGAGQTIVDQGDLDGQIWMMLEYQHDGQTWRQRHHYGVLGKETVVIVTGQAPASQTAEMTEACETIVKSLSSLK
ncbi:MAG: hypothetical protein JWP01_2557 [Myxococcales bacterium]|nr:hypothetical protein [Myxococcales bacterium]